MTPDEANEARIREVLLRTSTWYQRVLDLRDAEPRPDSSYLVDAREPLSRYGRQGASAALTGAMDHFYYWACLFLEAGRQPGAAHFTLMRATMEGSAIAQWLVDASVDSRVRIARGIGHYLDDLRERRIIEDLGARARREAGDESAIDWGEGKPAAARITELEEAAAVVGLCPVRATRTDLIGKYGPGERLYRVVCAFAHSGQAIPMAASVGTVQPGPGTDQIIMLTPDMGYSAVATQRTAQSLLNAIRSVFAYYGLDVALDDLPLV